jgi:hypothetical protein
MDVKIAAAACRESIRKSSAPDENHEFGKDHLNEMVVDILPHLASRLTSQERKGILG